jgi:protein involved in polysaccharide export with SLBB domain
MKSQPNRAAPLSGVALAVGALLCVVSASAAQTMPSASQAQQALQAAQGNPALIAQLRARLQSSGLSPDQIRARLAASGYPPDLLDTYLGAAQPGQAALTPGADQLAAMQALGLGSVSPASDALRADTGMIRVGGGLSAEELAAGNYVFGVDVFRRSTTQFLPTLAGPVPADYTLGPGDHLVLILTGELEFAYALQVTREGFVLVPQVGQIFVANLTLDQLRELLYARLGRVYSGVRRGPDATTRFDISVVSVRVNQVYVVGEVKQPGAYQLSALGTVLTSLYAAGGVTDRADLRRIAVRRLDKPEMTVDLYDYLLRGEKRSDIRLQTGDVVFVPLHGTRAQVTGAVLRPAIYELKPAETLVDLVRAAGGFRANAALKRLSVHRILPVAQRGPGPFPRAVLDVALTPPPPTSATGSVLNGVLVPSLSLEDGDSVVVDSVPPLGSTLFVAIAGMVNKPGQYAWREGVTLRDLVLLARGPKVGAYLKEAEVARLPADRSNGRLAETVRVPLDSTYLFERDSAGRYFGAAGLAFAAGGTPEVLLQPFDNVLILKQPDFELQRTVTITGEVRFAGAYALTSKDERVADLIDRAGGLTPQAYPQGIRFVRAVNGVGRINVDLPRALKDRTSRHNVTLQPGDAIEIPEYQPSVKVTGAVNSPGSVLWQRGNGLEYYLSAAGGFSYRADKGRVSVKYANGEVRTRRRSLLFTSNPRPAPGSEVYVPVKDTTARTDWVALVGAIAQILASVVTIAVVATKL